MGYGKCGVSLRSANVICTEELNKPAAKWGSVQYPIIIRFALYYFLIYINFDSYGRGIRKIIIFANQYQRIIFHMHDYKDKLKNITTFIFDFDGVLSDGKIWVLPDGDQLRATGVKDGYALQYALRKGYKVAVISGGISESMRLRYKNFPGMEIYLQVHNKVKVYNEYLNKYGLSREEVMMMGDDIPDYEIMQLSGLKCCPADAAEEIKAIADYVSVKKGGDGAARDIIEQTLKAQGRWFEKDACLW